MTDVKIAHSKSDGIASSATTSGGYLRTNYGKPDITFEDIAGQSLPERRLQLTGAADYFAAIVWQS